MLEFNISAFILIMRNGLKDNKVWLKSIYHGFYTFFTSFLQR